MDRLTHKRMNGIKTGYWSPAKKQELVDRLAEWESFGLSIKQMDYIWFHFINPNMVKEAKEKVKE